MGQPAGITGGVTHLRPRMCYDGASQVGMDFTTMVPQAQQNSTASRSNLGPDLWTDVALVVFLIGFDVAARLLWHVPNVSPVAASALFAGMMLRRRSLALVVPLAAMLIGDAIMGFYHWQVMAMVYAALTLPAVAGILARHVRALRVVVPTMLACSLIFFITTNFAVWVWSGLYSADMTGLIQCYVMGLPFLKYAVAGDLFWAAALFGGAWLVQRLTVRTSAFAS
jgi:hypothetical protein